MSPLFVPMYVVADSFMEKSKASYDELEGYVIMECERIRSKRVGVKRLSAVPPKG